MRGLLIRVLLYVVQQKYGTATVISLFPVLSINLVEHFEKLTFDIVNHKP
jgi:hypothetical protein